MAVDGAAHHSFRHFAEKSRAPLEGPELRAPPDQYHFPVGREGVGPDREGLARSGRSQLGGGHEHGPLTGRHIVMDDLLGPRILVLFEPRVPVPVCGPVHRVPPRSELAPLVDGSQSVLGLGGKALGRDLAGRKEKTAQEDRRQEDPEKRGEGGDGSGKHGTAPWWVRRCGHPADMVGTTAGMGTAQAHPWEARPRDEGTLRQDSSRAPRPSLAPRAPRRHLGVSGRGIRTDPGPHLQPPR